MAAAAERVSLAELPGGGVGDDPADADRVAGSSTDSGLADRFAQSMLVRLPRRRASRRRDRDRAGGTRTARHAALAAARTTAGRAARDRRRRGGFGARPAHSAADEAPGSDGFTAVVEAALAEAADRLDPAEGRMLQVVCLLPESGVDAEARALIVIHHLAVDGVSWRILIPDFVAAWQQITQGQPVELPAQGTSMRRWAHALADAAAGIGPVSSNCGIG